MKVNSNIPSLWTQNRLLQTQKNIARAISHLASGKRISSARDDAAGLAIATGIDAQVRGTIRGIQNMNDAYGFLETADSAMGTMTELVQRMRELTIQAANGTMSNSDRSFLNTEFQQLIDEYQRMVNQTDFNGTRLIDGSFGTKDLQVSARAGDTISVGIGSMQSSSIFTKTIGNGSFNSKVNYTAGSSVNTVRRADINGDGIYDIVERHAGTIGVLLGNGDGTFDAATTISTTSTTAIEVGDFNNDGYTDIVGYAGTNLTTYLNNGTGSFSAHSTTLANSLKGIATGDVNGDGNLDVVTAYNSGVFYLQTLLGTGSGTYTSGTAVSSGTTTSGNNMTVGDINGDGRADIAFTTTSNNLTVQTSNGDGTFTTSQALTNTAGYTIRDLQFADVTGDGKLDLVTYANKAATGGEVKTFVNNGTGTLTGATAKTAGTSTAPGVGALAFGDFNGDGYNDTVVSAPNENAVSVLLSQGNGNYGNQVSYATGTNPKFLFAGDMNNDGVDDIVAPNSTDSTISVLLTQTQMTSALNADMNIASQANARAMLAILDNALDNISSQRSLMGAYQNRLESGINAASLTRENLSQSLSNIQDVDYASETAELVREQILQQAQVSVLGQANVNLQIVLSLLRF